MPDYEWRFEPCEPDGTRDGFGLLWPHAAKGVKPFAGGRLVETGYGHTERGAMDDVKRRCAERDRRASVGERGEVVGVIVAHDAPDFHALSDALQQWSNPLVSTWGPAKGSRWHEGM